MAVPGGCPEACRSRISTFVYTPLQEPAQQLRLLQVGVDRGTQSLNCTLSTWRKPSVPNNIAISYTWGDPTESTYLTLNGKRTQVRQNCANALRQLWTHYRSQYCWIDSICIYSHRTAMKHLGIMRFAPQFSKEFN